MTLENIAKLISECKRLEFHNQHTFQVSLNLAQDELDRAKETDRKYTETLINNHRISEKLGQ